ncbi:AraC family transcriptional regulator (plasmid) [Sinorhizobium meliloti]|uniref:AraC family transcriptional regulator n=1 Tax=Rhizobium meliloti TaxID=382 RepID=UPI0002A54F2F|nr:AraC family transcriptional regulator [Sinorhizobium meliloti]AGA08898.1 AraC-type DNA-binding domain-containing protein [Sinorhizobium meliloti GR4]ASJ62101.1 AraC family transcriptional regulator [Sinorhizobium meliloti]MCK3784829.1 AraC family transcriptional regulator [Sinorhizobium meliloti]MCK3790954.1 AraC family transcriptional regulator [Sinorhizobium meliloti]MCK3797917.1 AraC family transcriptional regulator [Sinorhizobium meliloti]
MDPLTDIFSSMRIRKAKFTTLDATAPWGVASDGDPAIKFVLVVRGSAVLTTGENPHLVSLCAGDVFIIFGNEPYRVIDHEDSRTVDCLDVETLRVGNRIQFGGGGATTTFISGFFEVDRLDARPLLNVLPKLLHLKSEQYRSRAFQSVLELLAAEADAPGLGSDAVVRRLFELLFIHAIRAFAQQGSMPKRGWLAAVSDRNLALAIEAMHAEPQKPWTVDELAKKAGMSRSAFAARFKVVVGQTPLVYLTEWRICQAARLIERNADRLSVIARSIGYQSEAAFTKAFRKVMGTVPSEYRKGVSKAYTGSAAGVIAEMREAA